MTVSEAQWPRAPRPTRWPGRPLLASRVRSILRKEFGAQDAWIVHAGDWWRLEVRNAWRVRVLHEGDHGTFWAPFYERAVRNIHLRGKVIPVVAPTQRRRSEITALLRGWWERTAAQGPSRE